MNSKMNEVKRREWSQNIEDRSRELARPHTHSMMCKEVLRMSGHFVLFGTWMSSNKLEY